MFLVLCYSIWGYLRSWASFLRLPSTNPSANKTRWLVITCFIQNNLPYPIARCRQNFSLRAYAFEQKNIFKSYIVFLSSVLAFEYLSFVIHSYLTLNPHLAFIMFIPNSFNMFCLSVILVSWLFFFTIKDNTLRRYIGHLKERIVDEKHLACRSHKILYKMTADIVSVPGSDFLQHKLPTSEKSRILN